MKVKFIIYLVDGCSSSGTILKSIMYIHLKLHQIIAAAQVRMQYRQTLYILLNIRIETPPKIFVTNHCQPSTQAFTTVLQFQKEAPRSIKRVHI